MAPMTRGRAEPVSHSPRVMMTKYYSQRATAGLIVTEGVHISTGANGWENVPGIYSQEQVDGWRLITDAVHQRNGKIFCQLWHQGRVSHPDLLHGELPVAPSAVTAEGVRAFVGGTFVQSPTPRAATLSDIQTWIAEFKVAAERAVEAGFDGVELHAANGYLVHQFLSTQSNLRLDEYGGPVENRCRFLLELLTALKGVLPLGKVGVRLSPAMDGKQGMTVDQDSNEVFECLVKSLSSRGLAYLHLVEPIPGAEKNPLVWPSVAKHLRPMYSGTLMVNCGFTFDSGNRMIQEGFADLIAFGRHFIANPDLVTRFEQGVQLAEPDWRTVYTNEQQGYTDY